jgi:hypothetical protein
LKDPVFRGFFTPTKSFRTSGQQTIHSPSGGADPTFNQKKRVLGQLGKDCNFMETSDNSNVTVSYHATVRMRQMGLGPAEVTRAVAGPDVEYPGKSSSDGRPTRIAVRGRLAVVRSLDGVVVTVLWHRADARHAA